MCYLGSFVNVVKMISKLETLYDTIASYNVLMQNYYKINMDPKECVQAFATRMVGALNQIRTKFPHMLSDADMETYVKDSMESPRLYSIAFAISMIMIRLHMLNC